MTDEAFYLFANLEEKRSRHPEFMLKLAATKQPTPLPLRLIQHLQWFRIAIDPGHVGGDFALLKNATLKCLRQNSPAAHENIFFKKESLALLTGLLLKEWLEADGAIVFLTRDKEGQAVYEKAFFEWLAIEGYKHSDTLQNLFSKYN